MHRRRRGTRSRSDVAMEPQLVFLSTITGRRTIRQKERGSGGREEMEIHLEQSQSVQPRHRRRGRRGHERAALELLMGRCRPKPGQDGPLGALSLTGPGAAAGRLQVFDGWVSQVRRGLVTQPTTVVKSGEACRAGSRADGRTGSNLLGRLKLPIMTRQELSGVPRPPPCSSVQYFCAGY